MSDIVKVKIIHCGGGNYWYKENVGEVFDCYRTKEGYGLKMDWDDFEMGRTYSRRYIGYEDGTVLDPKEER
jgi:hypothetical protein